MTTQIEPTKLQGSAGQDPNTDVAGETPMSPPPKLRRRPLLWAIGIALIALGGLGAAWITTQVSDTHSVLALRHDVDRGSVITAGDMVVAQVSGDPVLRPVDASQENSVVGKRAGRDLTEGSLLSEGAITSKVVPATGQALVGVALTPGQLPATGIRSGDAVRIINTPRAQDDLPGGTPVTIKATVVDIRKVSDNGQTVVDVTVPTSDATSVASLVATGRVAIVVDGGR